MPYAERLKTSVIQKYWPTVFNVSKNVNDRRLLKATTLTTVTGMTHPYHLY